MGITKEKAKLSKRLITKDSIDTEEASDIQKNLAVQNRNSEDTKEE